MHTTTRDHQSAGAPQPRVGFIEGSILRPEGGRHESESQPSSGSNTTLMTNTPVTHLMAGVKLPPHATVKRHRYRLENPVNFDFLDSIELIVDYLKFAIKHGLVDSSEVAAVMERGPIARHGQAEACVALIHRSFTGLVDRGKVASLLDALPHHPDLDLTNAEKWYETGDHWEHDFTLSLPMWDDMHEEIHTCSELPLALVTKNFGLCVLSLDLVELTLDPQVKKCLVQLIYLCAYISGHATSVDLFTDDYIECIVTGTDYYLHEDEEVIIEDEDQAAFIEDYKESLKTCSTLTSGIEVEPSPEAINALSTEMEKAGDAVPDWMIAALAALQEGYTPGYHFQQYAEDHGGLPTPFLRPVGFGIPLEDYVLSHTHEMIAYGEEVSMLVKIDEGTMPFLTNVHLAENLLQYIQVHVNSMNESQAK